MNLAFYPSRPVGGTPALSPCLALFPPSLLFTLLPIFYHPFVLWLYHSSVFQSFLYQCALSSLLLFPDTHTLTQVLLKLLLIHVWWTPIFLHSVSSVPHAHFCSVSAVLFWSFNRFWKLHTPSSLLLCSSLIHCTSILQPVIISMAIYTQALSEWC